MVFARRNRRPLIPPATRSRFVVMPFALALLLTLFTCLAVVSSVVNPPYEAPDEIWHMAFIQQVASGGGLPISEPNTTALWRQQGAQAPGYYLAAAALTFWIDQSDFPILYNQINPYAAIGGGSEEPNRTAYLHPPGGNWPWRGAILALHLTRFFSVALGVITLWATYQAARLVAGEKLALAGTALFAFIPQFIFIAGSANNDNAISATAALLLWQLVLLLQTMPDPRRQPRPYLLIGLILGLALLSKVSALWLIAITAVVIAVVVAKNSKGRAGVSTNALTPPPPNLRNKVPPTLPVTTWLVGAGLAGGMAFGVAGWWFIRNWILYRDPLATNIWLSNILLRNRPATWRTLIYSEWESLDHSFWGLFGWFNVAYPVWLYRILQGLEVTILLGGLVWLVRQWRRGNFRSLAFRQRAGAILLFAWLMCLIISWVGFFRIAPAAQGRYFLPAAPTLAVGMAAGLTGWQPQKWRQPYLAWGVAGGLCFLSALTPHLLIAPVYRASGPLDSLPATAIPLNLHFGEEMQLVGYELTPTTLAPSTPTELTLYWRALRPMEINYSIGIKAFGRALRQPTVALDDSYPDAGRWATMYWPTDKIIVDRWRIWMSGESVAPTVGRLTVEVYELNQPTGQAGPPLAIVADGVTVASPVHFGTLVVRIPTAPTPAQEYAIQPLSPTLTLTPTIVTATFIWNVGQPLTQDYQRLFHLVADPAQPPLATGDGPPLSDFLPTRYWLPGDELTDTVTLTLPPTAAIGTYALLVGLYDHATLQRVVGAGGRDSWQIGAVYFDGERWSLVE